MKRNWDLIREVLIEVEALSEVKRENRMYSHKDDDSEKVEQALLLYRSNFIEAIDASSHDGPEIIVKGLTWSGHDLLQTIQSKPVWEKIKEIAQNKGIELTFDVVKMVGSKALQLIIDS